MHNTRSIFQREIRGFFNSPMAYIFLVIFSIFNGYFFTSTFFLYNQSDLRSLFSIVPMVYLIFVPAISMGLIARENNIGTMETIATLPLKTHEFILGKYFAAVALILLGLLATIIHFITLVKFGTAIDYGALFTGYIGLALVGSMYASIGTFASSITDNQVKEINEMDNEFPSLEVTFSDSTSTGPTDEEDEGLFGLPAPSIVVAMGMFGLVALARRRS